MFSFPQDASCNGSNGENLRVRMLKSLKFLHKICGLFFLPSPLMSQIMINSLLFLSFPTWAKRLPSHENDKALRLLISVAIIDMH